MKIDKLIQVFELLKQGGFGNQYVGGGHDTIFLPVLEEHPIHEDFELKLRELGAFWSKEYDCWIVHASC